MTAGDVGYDRGNAQALPLLLQTPEKHSSRHAQTPGQRTEMRYIELTLAGEMADCVPAALGQTMLLHPHRAPHPSGRLTSSFTSRSTTLVCTLATPGRRKMRCCSTSS